MIAVSLALAAVAQTDVPPARVVVEPPAIEIAVDASRQLRAAAFDEQGGPLASPAFRWLSTDPSIAGVDSLGVVTAHRPGTVRITAVAGGRPGFAAVTVPELPPATIELSLGNGIVAAGTSAPTHAAVRSRIGEALGDVLPSFLTENPEVARIDETGRVFGISPGRATIHARAGDAQASLTVTVEPSRAARYAVEPPMTNARTGDVVRLRAVARDTAGDALAPLRPEWAVIGAGAEIAAEEIDGVFVAERPGRYRITARIGEQITRAATIEVTERTSDARLERIGRGAAATHHSGDTWVFEGTDGRDYAYIGTFMHDWMKVWDVTDPAEPVLTDSVQVDARRINDVKIHPNNRLAIITREGASSRRNGIVLLDLSSPAHPFIRSEFTDSLTGGVHNVWIDGEHDLVYACHNGTSELHIIDISDPVHPRHVGRWGLDKPFKTLHDVIVQEGYAYLSYWDDGVVMLDVGAGTHGGTPTAPVLVSQLAYPSGNTHTAWRHGRYLFVGDEIYPPGWDADAPIEARGYVHVLDYTDPERPVEVARYEVPEAGAHNLWADGDRLYVGYYQAGLRVLDISGELRGDLYRQGRELAVLKTTDANTTVPNWSMTWGAQLFKGHIFTSDLNSGLWVARLIEERPVP